MARTGKIRKISYSKLAKVNLQRSTSINALFKDIKSYKPLTKEVINKLVITYHSSNNEAEKEQSFIKLCKHNMLLVVTIAKSYCSSDDNLDDLIQEGNIGLMKAIKMYNIEKGVPFHNYAAYWIRRYINLFKNNMTPIVTKTNINKTATVINTITNKLFQKLERKPTPDEILCAYNSQFPDKKLTTNEDVCNVEYVYIDNFEEQKNDNSYRYNELFDYNTASSSNNLYLNEVEKENNHKLVEIFTDCLTDKEKNVITKIFGLETGIEASFETISQEMGYTEQRIRQLYNSAIKKMKDYKERALSISKI